MLELAGVSRTVGGERHIIDVSLTLERGTLNVLLGPTLSGKTSLMRLMAGLDAPTAGRVCHRRQGRHRRAGAQAQRRDGLPAVHQLPDADRLREHRLAAAHCRRSARPRSTAGAPKAAELLQLTPYPRAHAARASPAASSSAPRSPAPSSRAPISCSSTSRSPISTTSCARNCARNCRRSSPRPARSSSMRRPNRRRRCSSAAAPRPCSKGRVTQFGETTDVYRRPHDLLTARTFSDPPLNVVAVKKARPSVRGAGRPLLRGRAGPCAASRRHLHARLPAAPPGPRRQPGRRRRAALRRHGRADGDHRLGKLRPCRLRRGADRRADPRHPPLRAGDRVRLCSRSPPPSRLRRRRRSRRRRPTRSPPEESGHGPHRLDHIRHAYTAEPRAPDDYALKRGPPRLARTAAPMRCSARPAAARPRCSTSSPAC